MFGSLLSFVPIKWLFYVFYAVSPKKAEELWTVDCGQRARTPKPQSIILIGFAVCNPFQKAKECLML
jgi:hypothetical protein